MGNKIILASSSPRRRELLESVGVEFQVIIPSADESRLNDERPGDFALRLSASKALSAASELDLDTIVIGADTVVVVDGDVLGKPTDEEDARSMLSRISGRAHHVLTAFSIVKPKDIILHTEVVDTVVRVKTLEPEEIEGYIKTGETIDKAGAYGIQGFGVFMIKSIEGSYTNVVGLPLVEVLEALNKLGAQKLFCGDGFRK